ncbi:hypothetical protein [Marinicella litoralis]|uniref:Uncharacterized protein n=1 Tax=Marinicella litoralis TaxID=644220 RepID=A0A4V3DIY4_9GAMM|nr:hypothetical protein [Marinicella litoralis]TDR23671.1 hypothetical protein C8D91_0535 [Marinicella litoralis]
MFEHIAVFFSIILSLGLVHLLGGWSLMLDAKVKVKMYWVHLLWSVNMMLLIALVWFANFALSAAADIGLAHYFVLLGYSISIYLMCALMFPVRGDEVRDFKVHYYNNRVRFCAVGLVFVITDALDGWIESAVLNTPLNLGQFGTLTVYALLFVVGMLTSSHRFHASAAGLFFLGLVGFLMSLTGATIPMH